MFLYLAALLLCLANACNINVRVEIQQATKPVFAQFTFHNETRSELYELQPNQKPFNIRIKGPICNMKPTILKTWAKKPANPDVPPVGLTFAFLEGSGDATYLVYGDIGPRLASRAGVVCGFGDCGGHGK